MTLQHETFSANPKLTWEERSDTRFLTTAEAYNAASEFCTLKGRNRVQAITVLKSNGVAYVTVWYWAD
jgi:hypothetical protein